MTRHKQQLLQEQENLLEQIQKQHNGNSTGNASTATVTTNESNNNTEQQRKGKRSPRNSPGKISISSSKSCSTKDDEISASMINRDHLTTTTPIKAEQSNETTSTIKTQSHRKSSDNHPSDAPQNTPLNHIENDGESVQASDNSGGGRLMAMLRDNPSTSKQQHRQYEVTSNGLCSPSSSCSPPMSSSVDKYHHHKNNNNAHRKSSSTSPHNNHLHNNEHHSKRQQHQPHVNHGNHSSATYAEHVEEMRKIDNSLFGRHMVSILLKLKIPNVL